MITKCIVQMSGGTGSWGAAKRCVERFGKENVTMLFADTKSEDPDLYRFLEDAAENVGCPLIKIADGRDIWQVFRDVKFLGNSRVDPCSRILKRDLLRAWLEKNADPKTTCIALGIDWTEAHRFTNAAKRWGEWTLIAPLCDKPYLEKCDLLKMLNEAGIRQPALNAEGFPHNNCGGGCIKAGISQFIHLYKVRPATFQEWKEGEQSVIDIVGDGHAILKDRRGGATKPMTLATLEKRIEAGEKLPEFEWGGCGCFSSDVLSEAN